MIGKTNYQQTYTVFGQSVTTSFLYDQAGNVTDDGTYSYEWEGRQLVKLTNQDTGVIIEYRYNDEGIKTYKRISMDYNTYDVDETLISMNYNGIEYFYMRNLQNDVIALLDKNGSIIVEYQYDAWGNIIYQTNNDIANVNPYKYRGYRYDEETGLYYLSSRYYNPEIGRFINGDDVRYLEPGSLNGLNLYAYCGDNPIMYSDPNGNSFILAMLIGAGIGALVGGVSYTASEGISYLFNGEFSWSWEMFGASILGGAIGDALTPFLGPGAAAFITGTSTSAIGMTLENVTGKGDYSFGEIFYTSLMIGSISAVTAGVLDNIPISGVNFGRGRLTAISKQINTKLVKNQITRVSMSTLGKMAYLNFIYTTPAIFINGFMDGLTLKPNLR